MLFPQTEYLPKMGYRKGTEEFDNVVHLLAKKYIKKKKISDT